MSHTITITFKLYASLTKYLPENVKKNQIDISIPFDLSITCLLMEYNVPLESAHLVLVNGFYIHPDERSTLCLNERDVLAVWPPVAGG
jgi:hypothetical protein